ncbi:DUF308 domain-containing protein [Caulobacter segnis]|uniref:DUF308 domain-containing protein n=1 Tax=Caulobacter segnis TaxID=88688 RepID=UPI0028561883|nr:DUF308 domain-containing protein [Caulobacter segnis]MDR6624080.1 uncharacterized membrane protein HdeD (DUF308 family) [Caulobacter segnis]
MAQVDDVQRGLKRYYFLRAAVSVAWILAAVAVGTSNPLLGGVLLVAYPAWDALANAMDARSNGGFAANPPQTFNLFVSLLVAAAVLLALQVEPRRVLTVFGVWAGFSGILQLVAGLRRWRSVGGQWPMVLSGAQSVLAGVFMITQSLRHGGHPPAPIEIAPYAGFGAFYFLVSAVALTLKGRKRA